jgi:hypothetical protein
MVNYRNLAPIIGFIIDESEGHLVLSSTLVYQKSKLTMFSTIVNETGEELKKGDKICYLASVRPGDQSVTIKKIIANGFPVAPTVKELLSQLRICITLEENVSINKVRLETFLQAFWGLQLNFITEEKANLLIHIEGIDKGAGLCPCDYLFRGVKPLPFNLKVPTVSKETLTFMHLVSKPILNDEELKLVLLSLRILHAFFHIIGYTEHVDLESMLKEKEALLRGDPSLASSILGVKCLMDWRSLHLLAAEYDPTKDSLFSAPIPVCSDCEEKYHDLMGLGLKDFETMFQNIPSIPTSSAIKQTMRQRDSFRYYSYGILYSLRNVSRLNSGALFGLSPIRFDRTITVSSELSQERLEENMLAGFDLFVPLNMIDLGPMVKLDKGLKILVEFEYSVGNDEVCYFSRIKILEELDSKLRIVRISALPHRLGLRRIGLKVRIKWGSSVNVRELSKAAKQVERLTKLKVVVDKRPDPKIDAQISKMDTIIKRQQQQTSEEIKDSIYQLQNIVDEIQPTPEDVLNKAVVIVIVLPNLQTFHGIPISTIGQVAIGEARFKMYVLLTMPENVDRVSLSSEACRNCFYRHTTDKGFKYYNYLAVFLIHELLHVTADVKDHCGECAICYFSRPELLPLRLRTCIECIMDGSNQVHINCLMSYACLQCIASRLDHGKNSKDFLCSDCSSKIAPPTSYIPSYFNRINNSIYRKAIREYQKRRYDLIFKAIQTSASSGRR